MTNLRGGYTPRFAAPAISTPTPTSSFVVGQRAVLVLVDEATGRSRYLREFRIAGEVFTDEDGIRFVKVATEPDWYAWTIGARRGEDCPHARQWPAELVWAE